MVLRFASLTLTLAVLLPGCGSGSGRLFADIDWRVRCQSMPGCDVTTPIPDHRVRAFSGEDGIAVTCEVTEISETDRRVFFSVTEGSGALTLGNARIQGECTEAGCGVTGGDDCSVTVREGANTFAGGCTPGEAGVGQPCSVQNVRFCLDGAGNPQVEGEIRCVDLEGRANPALIREVTAPGEGFGAFNSPATFDLRNCDGLSPMGLANCETEEE